MLNKLFYDAVDADQRTIERYEASMDEHMEAAIRDTDYFAQALRAFNMSGPANAPFLKASDLSASQLSRVVLHAQELKDKAAR